MLMRAGISLAAWVVKRSSICGSVVICFPGSLSGLVYMVEGLPEPWPGIVTVPLTRA